MEVLPSTPYRIVILASGNGTNAERLIGHFAQSELARVTLVLTNNRDAGVRERAQRLGVPSKWMSREVYGSGEALTALLQAEKADLVVLAGYLKLLPAETVAAFSGRIVNIHPSLLPRHGGKGMYGMRVHEAVVDAGEKESGITIHYVNEAYDEGKIILQVALEVQEDWSADTLARAIHGLEYAHFPSTIESLLKERRERECFPAIEYMEHNKKIQSALISVFHKEGLDPIAEALHAAGVRIISTGGTAAFIKDLGIPVDEVADLTDYPSILGGRVKTLHPKVFGGILARRDHDGDQQEMADYGIPSIDLVIVDLYPFSETVASGAPEEAVIEKIDIGGIALIRAAAKNHKDVLIVSHRGQYQAVSDMLSAQGAATSLAQRKAFAAEAFAHTFAYDNAIHHYLAGSEPGFELNFGQRQELRYGENPHQAATFHGDLDKYFDQVSGKALSYNNLIDVDAAVHLMQEFREGPPCFAIFKHTNPCGVAIGGDLKAAWDRALACDPVSAFGGILICNGKVEAEVAEAIREIFFEVLIAEDYSEEALEVLKKNKKRIILKQKYFRFKENSLRTAVGGVLEQGKDVLRISLDDYILKSNRGATASELRDVEFGEKVGKHLKSNAIAIVKDQQLIGSGIGQTSRVDALKQAIDKAQRLGFSLEGSVLYSDAFFPFADCAEISHAAGIEVLAEPGGSIRDQDTIDYCINNGLCLLFTGHRHFKH